MTTVPSTEPATAAPAPATWARAGERGALRASGAAALGLMALGLAAGGCVSVKAPDKPIVIELNVNIRQEVVYRLAQDAGKTIQSNPDIF